MLLAGRDDGDPLLLQAKETQASVLEPFLGPSEFDTIDASLLKIYAAACGWTLALAHARSGDPAAIAGYLGRSDRFDRAMVEFAGRYADQNGRDHRALRRAVDDGRVAVIDE